TGTPPASALPTAPAAGISITFEPSTIVALVSSSVYSSHVCALNRSSAADPQPTAKSRAAVDSDRIDIDETCVFLGRRVMSSSLKKDGERRIGLRRKFEEAVPTSCGAWTQQRPCPHVLSCRTSVL